MMSQTAARLSQFRKICPYILALTALSATKVVWFAVATKLAGNGSAMRKARTASHRISYFIWSKANTIKLLPMLKANLEIWRSSVSCVEIQMYLC